MNRKSVEKVKETLATLGIKDWAVYYEADKAANEARIVFHYFGDLNCPSRKQKGEVQLTTIPTHVAWVEDNDIEPAKGTVEFKVARWRELEITTTQKGKVPTTKKVMDLATVAEMFFGRRRGGEKNQYGFSGRSRPIDTFHAPRFAEHPERPLNQADYSVCQMVNAFTIGTGVTSGSGIAPPYILASAGTQLPYSMAFSLQDLTQVATFTAAFDQYRFEKVEVVFQSQSDAINVVATVSPNNSTCANYVVLDFDDSTTLANLAAAQEYDNVQVVSYGRDMKTVVHPTMALATWAGGAFSGYNITKAGWIDCANTAVAHYGIKGILTELTALSTQTMAWNVFAKYYVSFRNTR